MPQKNTVKYLGVMVDSTLSFKKHFATVIGKATSRLGFVRRNVTTLTNSIRAKVYKQLVRPTLEYSSAAWDTFTLALETELEGVQRRYVCNIRVTDRMTSVTVGVV